MKNDGILIIAAGSPMYGNLAVNLAVSLKVNDPEIKLCLVYTPSAITNQPSLVKKMFDYMIPANEGDCVNDKGSINYFRLKLIANKLTPFDRTLMLDADILWHPNKRVSDWFDKLSIDDFHIETRKAIDMENVHSERTTWLSCLDVKLAYDVQKGFMYDVSSQFVLWKRSKLANKIFSKALEVFDKPRVQPLINFVDHIADEACFSISLAINKITLPYTVFKPIYWPLLEKTNLIRSRSVLYNDYVATSFGGNAHEQYTKQFYSDLIGSYFRKYNLLQTPAKLQDKRKVLIERIKQ